MEENRIRKEISKITELSINKFLEIADYLDLNNKNIVLNNYIKKIRKSCLANKKKYVENWETINLEEFLRTGGAFQSMGTINWLYNELEPGFYTLFPNNDFKDELARKRQNLEKILQEGDSYHRQLHELL